MTEETSHAPTSSAVPLLPAWQPTFLALIPRKIKVGATFLLLLLALTPSFLHLHQKLPASTAPKYVYHKEKHVTHTTAHEQTDKKTEAVPYETPALEAIRQNDTDDRGQRMARAPDIGLSETVQGGSLPRISESGKTSWQVYARPFNTLDPRPRIGLVFVDLGLSNPITMAVVDRLHANVTTVFDSQSPVLGSWLSRAHQVGHETLVSIPMEPLDYPRSDPGPRTLLTNLPNDDNIERLYSALKQGSGYIGVTTLTGSSFVAAPEKLKPILEALRTRGLMVFDAKIAAHSLLKDMAKDERVPVAESTMRIDEILTPEAIDTALAQLEKTARVTGQAIGIASPSPLVIDRVEAWIAGLPARQIALAPLSAFLE